MFLHCFIMINTCVNKACCLFTIHQWCYQWKITIVMKATWYVYESWSGQQHSYTHWDVVNIYCRCLMIYWILYSLVIWRIFITRGESENPRNYGTWVSSYCWWCSYLTCREFSPSALSVCVVVSLSSACKKL